MHQNYTANQLKIFRKKYLKEGFKMFKEFGWGPNFVLQKKYRTEIFKV